MIKTSLRKIVSLAMSFGMATAFLGNDPAHAQAPENGRYNNFITTLKTLCATNKQILLGDTDHGALEILKLTSDRDVLQAIKDCGSVYVIEKGVEENKGYKTPQFAADPAQINERIQHIQGYLAAHGANNLKLNGEWDDATHEAFAMYIAKGQLDSGFMKEPDGMYTEAFAYHFLAFSNAGARLKEMFAAIRYLDGAGVIPVKVTMMTQYQDVQENPELRMPVLPRGAAHSDVVGWYQYREIFNAAKVNLPVVFPDPRHKKMEADEEMSLLLNEVLYANPDRSPAGSIYDILHMDALLNKDVAKRRIGLKLEKLVEESLAPRTNQEIVDNTLRLAGGRSVVLKYGSLHFSGPNDMNEMMGPQAVTILLKHRPDQMMLCPMAKKTNLAVGSCADTPQYVYDISSDAMGKIEKGSVAEQAYESMKRYSITPAEYAVAVGKLPTALKAYAFPYSEYDANPDNNRVPENWLATTRVYQFK